MIEFIIGAYLLLAGFLIYSSAHRAWNGLKPVVKAILSPFMLFYLVDVAFNLIFGSIMFLELPMQLTLTARCREHLKDTNFRGTIARALCNHMMDPFDPGHCK